MQIITSKDNEIIKNIKKLKEKKYRDLNNRYIIEGIKILKEAIEENAKIDIIVVCEDYSKDGTLDKKLLYEIAKYNCIYVDRKVFLALSDVQNPQGILAVIEKENSEDNIDYNQEVIVVLDGIQDPGNLGTIIRTIDSAGLSQVIVSKDTADCYNPKVVRSTMGAIFRVRVIESENLVTTLKKMKKHKFKIMATSLETESNIYNIEYNKIGIVIGNEGKGITKEVFETSDIKAKIPMIGKTESLNASVAAGIILYEYVRKKINQ